MKNLFNEEEYRYLLAALIDRYGNIDDEIVLTRADLTAPPFKSIKFLPDNKHDLLIIKGVR